MWFAGIDWADKHHDVVVLDVAGQQVLSRRVAHSAEGLASLTAELRALAPAPEEVVCVVERAHGLLIAALLEAGLWVAPVNPKTVDRTRPASGAKSDQLDALLLARAGRSAWPDLRRWRPDTPVLAELKTLTRDEASLIRQQTRVVNQLLACLKAYYPVVTELFDKLTRPVAHAFLRAFPTLAQARAASEAELRTVLHAAHCPSSAQKAARFWATLHAPQLEASPPLVQAKARFALALVAQLEVLHQRDRFLAAQQAHALLHATPPAQPAAYAAIRSKAAVVTRAAPEAARPTPLGARPVHPAGVGPRHRERPEGVTLTGCARRVGSAATERVGVLAGADGGHGGQG